MASGYVRRLIWELSVELAFDCFYASSFFPNAKKNHVVFKLKDSMALVVFHIRKELKRKTHDLTPMACFELAQRFLDDVELQLQIANGLGFLDGDGFRRLHGQAMALGKLMGAS